MELHFNGRLLDLLKNVRLQWKWTELANSVLQYSKITAAKSKHLSFVKLARIGTMIIPDGQKLSELYHDDTFMILESYWQ
jgi:hypothetical protein